MSETSRPLTGRTTLREIERPAAVLCDIDGTLVDSNYLQVRAWWESFTDIGHPVPAWRVHRAIGRDADQLLEALLGDDAEALGEAASEAHDRHYQVLVDQLRPLPGAREFIRSLAQSDVRVVLATSAPSHELQALRQVLQIDQWVHASTNADDADTAKPSPELVQVAVQRSGVAINRCVFIGDAVWDVAAAARAGVPCIGVRSGGIAPAELVDAGAVAVFDDVAHIARATTGSNKQWLSEPDHSR